MPIPAAYHRDVMAYTAPDPCEDITANRCPLDGVFEPLTSGRGENRCPQCGVMCPVAEGCVCDDVGLDDYWRPEDDAWN